MIKRFLVLDCEDSKAWTPISFGDMFRNLLSAAGDNTKWDICKIAAGDPLPATDSYNGIIITGSHYNVSDRSKLPWFDSVCHLIQRASAVGYPRIYGGCFGCQIMAHALGGGVGRNPRSASSCSACFVLKAERMDLVDPKWVDLVPPREAEDPQSCSTAARDQVIATAASVTAQAASTACGPCVCDPATVAQGSEALCTSDPDGLTIIESHGFCVCSLPTDSLLLATSASCNAEMWVAGRSGNLLAAQGHPEFEQQYAVWERIWPAVVGRRKALTEAEVEEAKQSLCGFSSYHSRWIIRLIRRFLMEHRDYNALVTDMMQREAGQGQGQGGEDGRARSSAAYFQPPRDFEEIIIRIPASGGGAGAGAGCCGAASTGSGGCSGCRGCFSIAAEDCCKQILSSKEEVAAAVTGQVSTASTAPVERALPLLNRRCPWSNRPVEDDSICVYECELEGAQHAFVVGFCNPQCRDSFVTAHSSSTASKGTSNAEGEGGALPETSAKYLEAVAVFQQLIALRSRK